MTALPRFFSRPAGILMLAMVPLSLLGTVSCESTPPPAESTARFGPGYPAGSAGWTLQQRETYRAAFDAGIRDQKEGYRYDDDRVTIPLDEALRSFSRQGYRAGYYHDAAVRRAARAAANTGAAESPAMTPGAPLSPGSGAAASPVPPPRAVPKNQGPDPFAVPLEPAGQESEAR